MQAVTIRRFGGPETLVAEETPDPSPGAGEVLIDVAASGVNFADTLARQGLYRDAPPLPFIPGYEVAGRIAALGPGVTAFEVGQPVLAFTNFTGYASRAVSPARGTFPLEEGDDLVEAAALPVNFVTAWHSIFRVGGVKEGDRVLVHAAAGGVGLAAVQMLKHAGAVIFGTAGGPKKIEVLEAHGVDHPIDYRAVDFERAVRAIAPEGIDLILDSIGGAYHKKGRRLLRAGGTLVAFGMASMSAPTGRSMLRVLKAVVQTGFVNPLTHMMQSKGYVGVNMKRIGDENPDLLAYEMQKVIEGWRAGHWKPVVAQRFPLAKVGEAHALLESRKTIGKVMLEVA